MTDVYTLSLWFYIVPILTIWGVYFGFKTTKSRRGEIARDEAIKGGMTEPASLHPIIDHKICLGCGACVAACPEHPHHKVLAIIDNKSHLVNPSQCIGHGACATACPHGAITLVFGTEKRGVDIPEVDSNFESNVSGIFIVGELGGMGLIKNAIVQGVRAIEYIKKAGRVGQNHPLDVVIVGAGPSGFAASLAAMEHNLRYATIEQDSLGGTVFQYPRGKIVMTAPVEMPMVGKVKITETTKEELLSFWESIEKKSGIQINYKERVESIVKEDNGFEVRTTKKTYKTCTVLLAIGRRGTPRKLGVPGEDNKKVVYRLIDPQQYRGQRVLVVGGGDSALEAASSIACEADTTVTLSYRSAAFNRAKEKNRQKIERLEAEGSLKVFMKSNILCITNTHIQLEYDKQMIEFKNDAVIINAGGILPTDFLKKIGISIETKYGTP